MIKKLSNRFVQICAIQSLNNSIRALSNVQPKPLTEVNIANKNDRKRNASIKIKVRLLQKMLNIQKDQAINIVSKSSKFSKITSECIGENHSSIILNGISIATLQKHPDILAEVNLPDKIELIKELPYDLDTTAPLLRMHTIQLENFIFEEDAPKKIKFLSKLFNVTEQQACEWISKRSFLIALKEEQIKDTVKVLADFRVGKNQIIKDFWVLKYSTSAVENRLRRAQKNNVDKLKTWMVRAKPEIFENYLRRKSEDKSILGDNSLVEYLSSKLKCSEETAKYIILKHPALQHKGLKKLNSKIDFLLANGFNSTQICSTPKILLHSVETIMRRLKELEAIGMQLDFLSVLTRSQKQYTQFYENLKASKTKNNSEDDSKN